MIFLIKKNDEIIFTNARWAGNPYLKMKGLLGRQTIHAEEALIFPKAPSIHTYFMKFSIDIVFLDASKKVVGFFERMKPNRIVPFVKSRYTIEMPENAIQSKKISLGDQLIWEKSGQVSLEYALLLGLLVLSVVSVWPSLAGIFNTKIRSILDYLNDF